MLGIGTGATPLYRAVEKGWAESAGTLLKHGPDPNLSRITRGGHRWGMAADAGREDIMGSKFRDQPKPNWDGAAGGQHCRGRGSG